MANRRPKIPISDYENLKSALIKSAIPNNQSTSNIYAPDLKNQWVNLLAVNDKNAAHLSLIGISYYNELDTTLQ